MLDPLYTDILNTSLVLRRAILSFVTLALGIDVNNRNLFLTATLLKQGYLYL